VSESAVSAKVWLGLVWRETGAVRNLLPSRGQAASARKRTQWNDDREATLVALAGVNSTLTLFGTAFVTDRIVQKSRRLHVGLTAIPLFSSLCMSIEVPLHARLSIDLQTV
jgi:hypothetical protein